MYEIKELIKTFERNAILCEKENERLRKEYIEMNPGEKVPEWYTIDFNINTALAAMCKAIHQLQCTHEWHEEEMRGYGTSKWFCPKCNLENMPKK